ncbi:SoxR reducing system protein RseC [mine drainage metagenome]|uniref:SoxR reducing system protein RseC n=1 Tax=mine drainage metagenome TaxID=410659 RepID=A0A1J5SFQ9_9ZZZZ
MIEEYAVVTGCSDHQATLEVERRTACGLCGQKRGCGNATWGKLLGHKSQEFSADNPIGAHVGDSVVVGIDERAILSTTFFLYVVPLLGMLLGTVLADTFLKNEFYVMLSAASGLVLAFLWVKRRLNGRAKVTKMLGSQSQAIILRYSDAEVESEGVSRSECKHGKISN